MPSTTTAPTSISHLVGQRGVVDQVAVALDAAQQDAKRFDHALLVGPPGVGKSQTATVIASEMASNFHEVLGQSLRTPADLNALLLEAKARDVVHIDECHEIPRTFQTALSLALDKRTVYVNGGGKPTAIPVADFTLLLSTTDEFRVLEPLRDRMKLVLRFDFYSEDELAELLRRRVHGLGWAVEGDVFEEIAQRSRGTPRIALRLLQSCHRVARSQGESQITLDDLYRACDLDQIDDLGLGATEQRYLAAVASGACRLNAIASILGLPARTVQQVCEPFLIRAGLIVNNEGRRTLTAAGHDHLNNGGKP